MNRKFLFGFVLILFCSAHAKAAAYSTNDAVNGRSPAASSKEAFLNSVGASAESDSPPRVGKLSTSEITPYEGEPQRTQWGAKVGAGMGLSQLVSESKPGKESEVRDSSFQMNLTLMLERNWSDQGIPLAVESGISLATQITSVGPDSHTAFSARYLDFPFGGRLYVLKPISFGLGGFLTAPIDSLDGAPATRRLLAPNVGVLASLRYSEPANRMVDWVFEANVQRGLFHIGNPGKDPNHIRNFTTLVGMAAHF